MFRNQLSPTETVAPASSRRSLRARLLGGASSLALPAAALVLGVSLAREANAQTTLSGTYTSTVDLANTAAYPNGNPFTFAPAATITTTTGDAVHGDTTAQWTLTNNGTVTGGASGIVLNSQSTVTNTGSITGTPTYGIGVYLKAGGSVTNQVTTVGASTIAGVISGYTGIFISNAAGTVTNYGTITGTGTGGSGVVLGAAGGSVTNQVGGVISGGSRGIYILNAAGTVTNAGSITGTGRYGIGVYLNAGGSVTNQVGGVISGGSRGIRISTAAGTVTNAGSITGTGTNGDGVSLGAGGSVTNQVGGTISGGSNGIVISTTAGTVTNYGSITGTGSVGVSLTAGGSVTNQVTTVGSSTIAGVISGYTGISISTAAGTVTNSGSITGTGRGGFGVSLTAGGSVTNQVTTVGSSTIAGVISGGGIGISISTAAGTVTNYGSITGTNDVGVFLGAGGSVANHAGGVISGFNGIDISTTAGGTVTNAGSITGTATNGTGVFLQAGGSVTNQVGGVISGGSGIVLNAVGTVTNTGSITATRGTGVLLNAGGSVTNQVTTVGSSTVAGVISGYYGVRIAGSPGTVTNAGTITGTGTYARGVRLLAGGSVTNQVTTVGTNVIAGVISGGQYGVRIDGGGTVTNAGTITATRTGRSATGVFLGGGGSVTNQVTTVGTNVIAGVISGGGYGVRITGSPGTVTNYGTITGAGTGRYAAGVFLGAGGSVTNQATTVVTTLGTSTIAGVISGKYGVFVEGGVGTVTNAGTITGEVRLSDGGTVTNVGTIEGVFLIGGGSVTNQVTTLGTNVIAGVINGVLIGVAAGTVTNAGTITGMGATTGVYLRAGGSVTNQVTTMGSSTIAGVISGGQYGVRIIGSPGTVTNAGTITARGATGVYLGAGGSVTNQVTTGGAGPIAGVISGGQYGVRITGSPGTVTNAGTITGLTGTGVYLGAGGSVTNLGVIAGVISGGNNGVLVEGAAGTVTNAGTITGGTNSVVFAGSGANLLTLQTGAVLHGTAVGSTAPGATNALVLQGTGTANNNFVNFNTLDVQAAAAWTLGTANVGTATVESGATLHVTGKLASFDGSIGLAGVQITNSPVTPGTSGAPNTLQINGNLTLTPGGLFSTTISPGTASLVNVTGLATLSGNAVQVTATSRFTSTETLPILTAGSISGAFSSVSLVATQTALARNPRLTEDAHDVFLTVDSASFAAVLPASATANQVNAAKGIDAALANGTPLPAGFQALGNLPATNLPGALAQLSGESATGSQQTTFGAMTQFFNTLLDPFIGGRGEGGASPNGATPFAEETSAYAANGKNKTDAYAMFTKAPPAPFEARWSTWAAGFGGSQTTDGNAAVGSNSTTSRIAGTAVGADYIFSPRTIAGFALAGGGTNFSVANGGTGRSDLFQAAAFIKHTEGAAYVSGALAYGWQDITTDRTVAVAGIDRLHAEFNANAFSGRVEGGYRFVSPWIGGIGITPYAAGQFTTFDLPAYAESALAGNNAFALAYNARGVTDSRSELGLRTDKSYAVQDAILTFRTRLAWAHDFNPDRTIAATFQSLPGASFVVGGAAQAPDSALTTASVEMKWRNGWSTAATFEGEFSNVTSSYAGKAVVRYNW
jgi:uncharacterized protein with beta-barrel porin domain